MLHPNSLFFINFSACPFSVSRTFFPAPFVLSFSLSLFPNIYVYAISIFVITFPSPSINISSLSILNTSLRSTIFLPLYQPLLTVLFSLHNTLHCFSSPHSVSSFTYRLSNPFPLYVSFYFSFIPFPIFLSSAPFSSFSHFLHCVFSFRSHVFL